MVPQRISLLTSVAAIALLAGCAQVEQAMDEVDAGFKSAVGDVRDALGDSDAASEKAAQDTLAATRYMDGDGVKRDPEKAVALLRPHAEDGYADAQFLLGLAYASGQGVAADKAEAVDWYRRAAKQGQAHSQYLLGLALLRGDGVAADTDAAAHWFHEGAKNGNAGAQYHLALGYAASGKDKEALDWFETAARQGHAEAEYMAGEFYQTGRGAAKNRAWATRWFGKAAAQGVAQAQYMLGLAFAAPSGAPRDLATAYTWMALAAKNGDDRAVKYRDGLAEKLSTEQRRRADRTVAAWKPAASDTPLGDKPTLIFVQYSLAEAGFDPGPVDGLSGPRTRDAIARYSSAKGMGNGTAVTPELLAALKKEWPAAS